MAGAKDKEDVGALKALASSWEPTYLSHWEHDSLALPNGWGWVVCLADWQVGKGEGGGLEALVKRVNRVISAVELEIRLMKPTRLLILGLGDLIEGCDGHYDMQTYSIENVVALHDQMYGELLTARSGEPA